MRRLASSVPSHGMSAGNAFRSNTMFEIVCAWRLATCLQLLRFDGRAVRAGPIQIDKDVSRLGPFARANDAAIFQFVHDTGRATVAEPQSPLQQRNAGFLFTADYFDALLDDLLVLVDAAFLLKSGAGL